MSAPVLLVKTKEANKARDTSSAESAQACKGKRSGSYIRRRFRKVVTIVSGFEDAVKILYYMTARTRGKVLANLSSSHSTLAAVFCQKLKLIVEKE